MIPKIIHYCWFGGSPLPETVEKCIDSWKRLMPDYEIKRWDETNFTIGNFKFAAEAYALKQYAFVADVCRVYVLSLEGGLYLDTDMFFIAPLPDSFLNSSCFLGWENEWAVAAGIIGADKNAAFMDELFDFYKNNKFVCYNGKVPPNLIIPEVITRLFDGYAIRIDGSRQEIPDYITLYPKDYFYPKDYTTGLTEITGNTIAIHLYDASWHSEQKQLDAMKSRYEMRLFKTVDDLKQYYTDGEIIAFFYRAMKISPWGYIKGIVSKLTSVSISRLSKMMKAHLRR